MSLGQKDDGKELKVPTWANRPEQPDRSPGDLTRVRVAFYGIKSEDYAVALANAVFQLKVETQCGSWVH